MADRGIPRLNNRRGTSTVKAPNGHSYPRFLHKFRSRTILCGPPSPVGGEMRRELERLSSRGRSRLSMPS